LAGQPPLRCRGLYWRPGHELPDVTAGAGAPASRPAMSASRSESLPLVVACDWQGRGHRAEGVRPGTSSQGRAGAPSTPRSRSSSSRLGDPAGDQVAPM
jgi:hypothetical protein